MYLNPVKILLCNTPWRLNVLIFSIMSLHNRFSYPSVLCLPQIRSHMKLCALSLSRKSDMSSSLGITYQTKNSLQKKSDSRSLWTYPIFLFRRRHCVAFGWFSVYLLLFMLYISKLNFLHLPNIDSASQIFYTRLLTYPVKTQIPTTSHTICALCDATTIVRIYLNRERERERSTQKHETTKWSLAYAKGATFVLFSYSPSRKLNPLAKWAGTPDEPEMLQSLECRLARLNKGRATMSFVPGVCGRKWERERGTEADGELFGWLFTWKTKLVRWIHQKMKCL